MSAKEKVSSLITYLYETMNGELARDYAELDSENIELLLKELERLYSIIKEVREYIENNKQYAELEDYGKNGEYYIDEIGVLEILGSD